MMSLKVPRVVLQEACPEASRKHAIQLPGLRLSVADALCSLPPSRYHITILVICHLIAAQMPTHLSLEDNERLLKHIIQTDMCSMFIMSIKHAVHVQLFASLLEASCPSHSASPLSWHIVGSDVMHGCCLQHTNRMRSMLMCRTHQT